MYKTHKKGELAQLKVEMRAIEKGIVVCRPTTEARFDLIFVDESGCKRVQVKYADHTDGYAGNGVEIDLRRQCRNDGNRKTYSKDEIDVVIAYLPAIDKLVWLDPEDFDNKASITFRLQPSANGQTKGVRLVADYEW